MIDQDISTEPKDSEYDARTNMCPICKRGFNTMGGLRQHWSKVHTEDEINEAIARNTQQNSQGSPTDRSTQPPTAAQSADIVWNKLQIINDDVTASTGKSYHQFAIIENNAMGDCLFSAILEFLRSQKSLSNIPRNVNDLRSMTVNYILMSNVDEGQSNFDRFKESLIENLQHEIQNFSSTSTANEMLKTNYARYMSSPGKYGTTAELCAMAEIFNFSFCVIRRIDHRNYTCYDFGSTEKMINHQTNSVVHLLFSGNVGGGHFRLLSPSGDSLGMITPSGTYKLVEDHTSSRLTSIAPTHFSGFTTVPNFEQPPNNNTSTLDTSFDDFVILLARCKSNIRVLKRVPRAARILAANRLSKCVEECLASPKLAMNWKNLLTFAYTSLRVPDKVQNVSLATSVKRNIEKAELIFTKEHRKKTQISLSKRVEHKIAEGDIRGAVRILSSTDNLAPQNVSTFEQLKLKHPPPSREMSFPDPQSKDIEPLVVSERDIFYSIKSFPNGSGSGIDGLLPQHLKDLTLPSTGEAGLRLLKSITALSNYMLSGKVQSDFIKIMYGASLCALDKKGGGVRPIAVGNTFRRLTSKLASASVRSEMASKFAPRQVGFGIKGGCEAAAHATRTFIKKNKHRKVVIVKIDFRNAFNEVDRDIFLSEMQMNCPAIFPYLMQCYSSLVNQFEQLSPGICIVNEFTLLGTSITDNAFGKVFDKKLSELKLLFERLRNLDNYHIAFYILKNCFAIPKLVFLLRTTPTWNHMDIVDEIDSHIKSTLETLTNSSLESVTWTLASLPVNVGGIGIRRVRDTALPAFLSSVNAVSPLISTMLNLPTLNIGEIADYEDTLSAWNCLQPDQIQPENPSLQKNIGVRL